MLQREMSRLGEVSKALAPLSLMSIGAVNILLYYTGVHGAGDLRRTQFTGVMIAVFVLALARAGQLYLEAPARRKRLLAACAIPGALYLGFALAFVAFGARPELRKSLLESGVICIPAFVFAVDTVVSRGEAGLFMRFERWSLVLLPAAIIYIAMGMTSANPATRFYLGQLDYLTLAYTYATCVVAVSVPLLTGAPAGGVPAPFAGWIRGRAGQACRAAVGLLFWALIILSGARGAILSLAAFYLVLLLRQGIRRRPARRILAALAGGVAILAAFVLLIRTPSGERIRQRFEIVAGGLKKGLLIAEPEDPFITANIDRLVALPGGRSFRKAAEEWRQGNDRPVGRGGAEAKPQGLDDEKVQVFLKAARKFVRYPPHFPGSEQIRWRLGLFDGVWENAPLPPPQSADAPLRIGNRGTLFTLAVKEFLKSPIYGMGPLGFLVKYENYPHNFALEILCELGLLGAFALLAAFLALGRRLLAAARREPRIGAVGVVLLGLAIPTLISGTFWNAPELVFACAYAAVAGFSREAPPRTP